MSDLCKSLQKLEEGRMEKFWFSFLKKMERVDVNSRQIHIVIKSDDSLFRSIQEEYFG